MIRAGAREALWQGREVIAGAGLGLIGLWLMRLGGYLLLPLGAVVVLAGIAFAVLGLRRMRFGPMGDAPGVVTVDEAQIAYMGPQSGGFVSLDDLSEIRLLRVRGRRVWRLKQADGQALLVPLDAAGAEGLFDAFAALPGLSSAALVSALGEEGPGGPALVSAAITENRLVWRRKGAGIVAG